MPRKIRVATVVDRRPRGAITCLGVDKVNKPEVVSYIPLQLHNYTAFIPGQSRFILVAHPSLEGVYNGSHYLFRHLI
jgi:hypothetical protein